MNIQKLLVPAAAAFVFLFLIDYLFYGVIMADAMSGASYMRPDGPDYLWLGISYLVFSLGFVTLYTKSAGSGSKMSEGINYGIWITVLVSVAAGFMWYSLSTMMTLSEAIMDMGYSLVKFIILGIIVAHLAGGAGARGKDSGIGERGKDSGIGERGKATGSGE